MHAYSNVICRYVSFYVLDHMLHNESKNQLNFVFKDRASNDEILRYVTILVVDRLLDYVSFYVLDHMLQNESKNQLNLMFIKKIKKIELDGKIYFLIIQHPS